MSDSATRQILIDLLHYDALAICIGLGIFALLRLAMPLDRWGERGNVYTAPFDWRELCIVIGILVFLLKSMTPLAPGASAPEGGGLSLVALIGAAIIQVMLAGGLIAYLALYRRIDLGELFGLARMPPERVLSRAALFLLPTFAVVLGGTILFNHYILVPAIGEIDEQRAVQTFAENKDLTLRLLLALSAVIIAPICEELLFRGLIYGTLKRFGERIFAALASSLLFALIHGHVPSILPLTILALGFCIAYERTGCLWVPIAMHAMFNGFNLVMMWMRSNQM